MSDNIRYVFIQSRSGESVPAIITRSGETLNLHSTVDPKHEARRLISSIADDTGFLIFLGLGGGFAPDAALEMTNAGILVIDYEKDSIAKLLAAKDYAKLLSNERFCLLIDPSNDEIRNNITSNYKPALNGGIKTIPLRARTEQSRAVFETAASAIHEAVEIVSGDYSVQSQFGIRWFSNIIRNLKNIENNNIRFFNEKKQINNTAIAAAGPSLDSQLPSLARAKEKGDFVICCDTALPPLLQNGIIPDAVVTIDCQHISYHHFIGRDISNIPLILDIAGPPSLFRLSQSPAFFISGHPLAGYINSFLGGFVQLDTSGGNVAYTCLSLAQALEARKITFYGADFSYIKSRTYAKGAYIYPYFEKSQNRFSPIEARASALLYRSPFLPPEDAEKYSREGCRYHETSALRFYRKKLEEKITRISADITFAQGQGCPVNIRAGELSFQDQKITGSEKKNHLSGINFLEQYRNDIIALPETDIMKDTNINNRKIFTTLLPLAAAVKKRNPALKQKDLIREVKIQSANRIEKVLNNNR